jgi:hypothetical protein
MELPAQHCGSATRRKGEYGICPNADARGLIRRAHHAGIHKYGDRYFLARVERNGSAAGYQL